MLMRRLSAFLAGDVTDRAKNGRRAVSGACAGADQSIDGRPSLSRGAPASSSSSSPRDIHQAPGDKGTRPAVFDTSSVTDRRRRQLLDLNCWPSQALFST